METFSYMYIRTVAKQCSTLLHFLLNYINTHVANNYTQIATHCILSISTILRYHLGKCVLIYIHAYFLFDLKAIRYIKVYKYSGWWLIYLHKFTVRLLDHCTASTYVCTYI